MGDIFDKRRDGSEFSLLPSSRYCKARSRFKNGTVRKNC
ncbi:hypothetical protein FHX75_111408 [Micromonospora palomenae]|uniref:Uncharacterized protein n=1 Tax=Micromonospora palomenae TaxID=1461247 RepID=A0A561WWL1_9ACTN|nr:hypothetical protein FHX75_111408 [Micromonospora palomenae]